MLPHELEFLKSCREMRGSQDSVRYSVNYPTQSTASSIAALTGYELSKKAKASGWELSIPGFIHDCLEGDFGHTFLLEMFENLPQFAEDWPYETFGLPLSLDIEIGVRGGPYLVEFKRAKGEKKFVKDGVMRSKFEGRKNAVEELFAQIESEGYYKVNVVEQEEEDGYVSWKELYLRVASSYNLSFGTNVKMLKGVVEITKA